MANSSTLIGRRNYGMKIAMPGFDAQYAGDNQLLFNSSFPILQIKVLSELYALSPTSTEGNLGGEYIGTLGLSPDRVYRWYHGLGYPPFFLILSPSGGLVFSDEFMVDDQYIYRKGGWQSQPIKNGTRVLVCPIDLTHDIEYPYTAMPLERPMFNEISYGFKSVEFGDIVDDNFDNLGIDIRLQSQMVLATKTFQTSDIPSGVDDFTTIAVDYMLPPGMTINDVVAYGFAKQRIDFSDPDSPMAYRTVGQSGQAVPSVFINYPVDNNIQLQSFHSQPGSLVVVRQPLVAADRQEVTI